MNSATKARKLLKAIFSTQPHSGAMKDVKRAYFTYPVADGLLEGATIFAAAARDAHLEVVVNNSQFQGTPEEPGFRDLQNAPSFRNLQHRLADRIFDWAQVGAVHLQAPPYYENVRALVTRSVADQGTAFLPWGDGSAVIPLASAEDVGRVAATLLASPGLPTQTVYPLVNEAVTVREIVKILGRAVRRPIRYLPITDEEWADAVKERMNRTRSIISAISGNTSGIARRSPGLPIRSVQLPAGIRKRWRSSFGRMPDLSLPMWTVRSQFELI